MASRQNQSQSIRPETSALYTSSVYTFPSLEAVAEYYGDNPSGHFLYRRNGHPNEGPVESALARMENAESAALCASGMGAIAQACFAHLTPGDHVIATRFLYGGSYALFEQILKPWGVDVTYVDLDDLQLVKRRVRPETKLVFAESIANPLLQVADLQVLGELTAELGLKLFVDNTFATPMLVNPLSYGATLSIHSLTKYLNGHSDVVGGVVIGSHANVDRVRQFSVTFGGTLSPFDAWQTERGLQTFHLRFPVQCENALRLSSILMVQPNVTRVFYPGVAEHESHSVAKRILSNGYGAMITFEVDGGFEAANRFVQSLKHIRFAPSLGGVHTTLSHPALTSHRAYSETERTALGITQGLLRMSVGTEPIAMIEEDILQALAQL